MSKHLFLAISFILLFSFCATLPTGKSAFITLSEGEEVKMGTQAYKQILAKEQLSKNATQTALIKRVGKRIAVVAHKPKIPYKWEFSLIQSNQVNAFCLPGGKVAFYTAILPICKNEAGVAAVMGHEVTHAIARHSAQRISQQMALQTGLKVLSVGLLNDNRYKGTIMSGLGVGATYGVVLPFSRAHESEADSIGLQYLAKAGYDPSESVRLWERMDKLSKGRRPAEFMSTHPDPAKRARALAKQLPAANKLYANASPKYGLGETIR